MHLLPLPPLTERVCVLQAGGEPGVFYLCFLFIIPFPLFLKKILKITDGD